MNTTENTQPLVTTEYKQSINTLLCYHCGHRPKDAHPRKRINSHLLACLDDNPNEARIIAVEIAEFTSLFSQLWVRSGPILKDKPLPVSPFMEMIQATYAARSEADRFVFNLVTRITSMAEVEPDTVNSLIDRFTIPEDLRA